MAAVREYSKPKVEDFNILRPTDVYYQASLYTKGPVDPGNCIALLRVLIDKLTEEILPLLNKFRLNATKREVQKHNITTETETKFYKTADVNPSKIEKGLPESVTHITTYQDAYLELFFEFLGILGIRPVGYGAIDKIKHYHYQTTNYFVQAPVAMPQQMLEYKYSLVCKCPNFDMNISSELETSAKWKYYYMLEADQNTMTLLINVLTGWLVANNHPYILYALSQVIKGQGWAGSVQKVFASTFFNESVSEADAFFKRMQDVHLYSEIFMHVHSSLERILNTNMDVSLIRYFTMPIDSPDYKEALEKFLPLSMMLQRALGFQKVLQTDTGAFLKIKYNLNEFNHTTYTVSGIVSTVKKITYRLDQGGNIERFHTHPEVVLSESLYKMLSPIARKIIIKDSEVKIASVVLKDSKVQISEKAASDNERSDESYFMESTEQYVSVGLQTSNWDDAIGISKIIPKQLSRIDVSYKFNADSVRSVVEDFIKALSQYRIVQMSVNYENISRFGTCDYTFFSTAKS